MDKKNIGGLHELDFHYGGVDIDYNSYYDCASHGCHSDGICRCEKINPKIQ